jgi:hypothetical protein
VDDAQDRLVVPHLAYLLGLGPRSDLSPFALWPAFSAVDYSGDSVALGVAPRGSISCCTDPARDSAVQVVDSSLRSDSLSEVTLASYGVSGCETLRGGAQAPPVERRHISQRCGGVYLTPTGIRLQAV